MQELNSWILQSVVAEKWGHERFSKGERKIVQLIEFRGETNKGRVSDGVSSIEVQFTEEALTNFRKKHKGEEAEDVCNLINELFFLEQATIKMKNGKYTMDIGGIVHRTGTIQCRFGEPKCVNDFLKEKSLSQNLCPPQDDFSELDNLWVKGSKGLSKQNNGVNRDSSRSKRKQKKSFTWRTNGTTGFSVGVGDPMNDESEPYQEKELTETEPYQEEEPMETESEKVTPENGKPKFSIESKGVQPIENLESINSMKQLNPYKRFHIICDHKSKISEIPASQRHEVDKIWLVDQSGSDSDVIKQTPAERSQDERSSESPSPDILVDLVSQNASPLCVEMSPPSNITSPLHDIIEVSPHLESDVKKRKRKSTSLSNQIPSKIRVIDISQEPTNSSLRFQHYRIRPAILKTRKDTKM